MWATTFFFSFKLALLTCNGDKMERHWSTRRQNSTHLLRFFAYLNWLQNQFFFFLNMKTNPLHFIPRSRLARNPKKKKKKRQTSLHGTCAATNHRPHAVWMGLSGAGVNTLTRPAPLLGRQALGRYGGVTFWDVPVSEARPVTSPADRSWTEPRRGGILIHQRRRAKLLLISMRKPKLRY